MNLSGKTDTLSTSKFRLPLIMPGKVFLNNIMLQSVDLLSSITYQYIVEFKATCTLERIRMLPEVTQKTFK